MIHNRIIIIDGNSLVNRAFFAMPPLTNREGVPTNAVYGFMSMLFKLIEQYDPEYLTVAFDMKAPTFRHQAYDGYKATRKGMPEELAVQMPILKEFLDALGIHRTELEGYEADDLIGTIARVGSEAKMEVLIVTGDKDSLQLVDSYTRVLMTKKGISQMKTYDPRAVEEEFGLTPSQIVDLKGLSGDTSDNIPGIPGVGPKTAVKLLEAYGTVEGVLAHMAEIEGKRLKELVHQFADQAVLSKRLATIMVHVPVDFNMEEFAFGGTDHSKAIALFKDYQLNSLLKGLKFFENRPVVTDVEGLPLLDDTTSAELTEVEKTLGTVTQERLSRLVPESCEHMVSMFKGQTIGIQTVYEKRDLRGDLILCTAICTGSGETHVLSVGRDTKALTCLAALYGSPEVLKVAHDAKREMLIARTMGVEPKGFVFDTMIAAYLLEPERSKYLLSDLCMQYETSITPMELEEIQGKGAKQLSLPMIPEAELERFAADAAKGALELSHTLGVKMEEANVKELFERVEMPLVDVLADIEFIGFTIDQEELSRIDVELTTKIAEIEGDIYAYAGGPFNIQSPKQLGEVLFERLELPTQKKTKTGYSTNHDTLQKLENMHPIIPHIMEYRTYSKLKSTYIDGLRAVLNPITGRVHTSLNQTVAATGRLSSTEPNLQNIPVRLAIGRKLRKMFIAKEGCQLVDADYSQIELRILAHLSMDGQLAKAYKEGIDVHTLTASQVFDIPVAEVTSLERSRAKEVNFGIVYGMSDFGLSENLGITRKEAKRYIENYFIKYPNVKGFMDGIIEGCRENGFVTTILNRRRYLPDIGHKNFMLRSLAERMAMNTPIQGSAADIIKLAMIKVHSGLKTENLKSQLILQVHDELIVECYPDEIEAVKRIVKSGMEDALVGFAEFTIPLTVEMHEGRTWYDAK